jgi:UDP-glucose 4-epimerase
VYAVVGANGFIGRHVVARLAAEGLPVRAISRRFDPEFETGPLAARVAFVEADIRDPFASVAALEGVSAVLQLVSTSSPGLRNDYLEADITDNVIPQVRFARDALAAGVERYVFLSSGGAVYGRPRAVPIPEDHPLDPLSSHGVTKLACEKYLGLLAATAGLEAVVLRVSNPFGPGQVFRKGQGLVPAILERQARGQPVTIFGDGSARRDYVYIGDVVDAVLAALRLPGIGLGGGPERGIFNVGSGEGRSVLEILAAVEARLGAPLAREHVPARASDVEVNVLAIDRARAVLGWTPATPFEAAMDRTLGSRPGPGSG